MFTTDFFDETNKLIGLAVERFPEIPADKWHLKIINFADGDYQINLIHTVEDADRDRYVFYLDKLSGKVNTGYVELKNTEPEKPVEVVRIETI